MWNRKRVCFLALAALGALVLWASLAPSGLAEEGAATFSGSAQTSVAEPPGQDFPGWARFLYPFGLSAAAILAVFMLVFAGVQMMAAVGNPGMIESAKGKIWSALLGLLIAVGSYLILRTINPQLLNLQINAPVAPGSIGGGPGGGTGGGGGGGGGSTPTQGFRCSTNPVICRPNQADCANACGSGVCNPGPAC